TPSRDAESHQKGLTHHVAVRTPPRGLTGSGERPPARPGARRAPPEGPPPPDRGARPGPLRPTALPGRAAPPRPRPATGSAGQGAGTAVGRRQGPADP